MHERGQDPPIRHLDEAQKEGRNALRPPQTHPRPGSAPITWPMRRKRRIPPRRHRPEPPQTGQDLSRNAANPQSLITKARVLDSTDHFLRQQHVVFQRNRRNADVRRKAASKLAKSDSVAGQSGGMISRSPSPLCALRDSSSNHQWLRRENRLPVHSMHKVSSLRIFVN